MAANRRFLGRRGQSVAAKEAVARRQREDEAPRLKDVAGHVKSLKFDIEETQDGKELAEVKHTRRIVVDYAPAWFEFACTEANCGGGGHDITQDVLASLNERKAEFAGEHACTGSTENAPCKRVLIFEAIAEYND